MLHTRVRRPRPVLLLLVFGAFLAIIGMTATAQSVLVSTHFSTGTLNDIVGSDAATTRAVVNAYVRPADLEPGAEATSADRARLAAALAALVRPGEILGVELRRPDGSIVAASDPASVGRAMPVDGEFALALDGTAQAAMGPAAESGSAEPGPRVVDDPSRVPADRRRRSGSRRRRDLAGRRTDPHPSR